ncbi:MAG: hypothetical protein GKS00_12575 [Alphaproteobacteria bacterium]|nr:hypothetical protein [Alphaproteobacteria bacterium]
MTNLALRVVQALQSKVSPPSIEATLAAVIDEASIGYLLLGPHRRVLRCGGSALVGLGFAPRDLIGDSLADLILGRFESD